MRHSTITLAGFLLSSSLVAALPAAPQDTGSSLAVVVELRTMASGNNNTACSLPCPTDQVCVVRPDTDEPACVVPRMCGGFAGLLCPLESQACVDDPRDGCHPEKGGRDCAGLCVDVDVDVGSEGAGDA